MLLAYIIKLTFFFLLPAIPGYIFFSRFLKEDNSLKAFVYALGISPVFSLLIFYYFLLLFKDFSTVFYLSAFLIAPFIMLLYPDKSFSILYPKWNLLLGFLIALVGIYVYVSGKSLSEHDTLEYALQGKHFFNQMSVNYTKYPFHPENGFYYVGLHGFAFPLIYTWELMFNQQLGTDSIILFKLINPLYACLLLLLVYEEVKSFGEKYALWAVLILALSIGFIFNALQFHLEMFRQYLFLAFVALFVRVLKDLTLKNVLLFAAVAGMQSTVHSIGAIASVIAMAVLFVYIFLNQIDKKRLTIFAGTAFLILFGWIHYILDIFIGTGWILR